MKQTENFGLNLLETADLLSPRPLNENAEKVEAALGGMAGQLLGRVMLATGSYTGDGTKTVTIQTPGFTPKTVLIRKMAAIGGVDDGAGLTEQECRFTAGALSSTGWVLWRGEDIAANYYYASGTQEDPVSGELAVRYSTRKTTIHFTPEAGSLSWELAAEPEMDHSPLVNNEKGTVYEWLALGLAQE